MSCPKNCNGRGSCNFDNGVCTCNDGFIGDDCGTSYAEFICPGNCSNNGRCDLQIGKLILF
jgi:EGF-like domain